MTDVKDCLVCPRCKKETDTLNGGANGYYDKITKKFWASSSIITNIDNTVCKDCYHEIRMQDKDYARKHQDDLDRKKSSELLDIIHKNTLHSGDNS